MMGTDQGERIHCSFYNDHMDGREGLQVLQGLAVRRAGVCGAVDYWMAPKPFSCLIMTLCAKSGRTDTNGSAQQCSRGFPGRTGALVDPEFGREH